MTLGTHQLGSNLPMLSEVTLNAAALVSLTDYSRPVLIVLRLREGNAADIISELTQVLQRQG